MRMGREGRRTALQSECHRVVPTIRLMKRWKTMTVTMMMNFMSMNLIWRTSREAAMELMAIMAEVETQ